ncbi:hypothetical protein HaLaN_06815, partial [Haematococcus lacustris]
MGQFGSHRPPQDIAFAPARSIAQAVDALQTHVTVQSSATGAGGASLVLVCPGTSQGSIRDRCHTHVSVASTSTQQPKFHVALTMRSTLTWVCNPSTSFHPLPPCAILFGCRKACQGVSVEVCDGKHGSSCQLACSGTKLLPAGACPYLWHLAGLAHVAAGLARRPPTILAAGSSKGHGRAGLQGRGAGLAHVAAGPARRPPTILATGSSKGHGRAGLQGQGAGLAHVAARGSPHNHCWRLVAMHHMFVRITCSCRPPCCRSLVQGACPMVHAIFVCFLQGSRAQLLLHEKDEDFMELEVAAIRHSLQLAGQGATPKLSD